MKATKKPAAAMKRPATAHQAKEEEEAEKKAKKKTAEEEADEEAEKQAKEMAREMHGPEGWEWLKLGILENRRRNGGGGEST